MSIEVLGYCAGFLTTVSFIPQAVKIWRSRSAHDVSLPMLTLLALGLLLWAVYGFITCTVPIILANVITLILVLAVVGLKVRFDARNKCSAQ